MFDTLDTPATPQATPLLEIVMTALEATWRIPDAPPETGFPDGFRRDALRAFSIERVEGGYVANIHFDRAPGEPDVIGTPESEPLPTYREAFLAGTMILSEIVTGSQELPFLLLGDDLLVVTVTDRGAPFIMRRPFPTQCV